MQIAGRSLSNVAAYTAKTASRTWRSSMVRHCLPLIKFHRYTCCLSLKARRIINGTGPAPGRREGKSASPNSYKLLPVASMWSSTRSLLFLPICFSTTLASFLTGTYPSPIDLTSQKSIVAASWKNFSQTTKNGLNSDDAGYAVIKNVTWSVGLFSLHDPAASSLQLHHTSAEVANSPNGTKKVDGDSIYRVASVSKLFTVFLAMTQLSEEEWNSPISRFIPELTTMPSPNGSAYTIDWDAVTPWALASQMAGIPQLGIAVGDSLVQAALGLVPDPVKTMGFPPEGAGDYAACLTFNCTAAAFAQSIRSETPTFQPWTNPAYSDLGFMLLGLVVSAARGAPIAQLYRDSLFTPLGMASSNATLPTGPKEISRLVVAEPTTFFLDGGVTTPSGGILSSLNDLNKLGVGLLNSTLLAPNVTRKWMKPVTHTPSLTFAVGAPWEIFRYIHPSTGKVTDLYTKLGDSGSFGGAMVVIPEYGAGISFAGTASNSALKSAVDNVILDTVIATVLPALEAQAQAEAKANFAGTYTSSNPKLNSTVTIAVDKATSPGKPKGLSVTRWISNGTDVLASDIFGGFHPVLLPSIPNPNAVADGPGQTTFQASTNLQLNSYLAPGAPKSVIGPFTGSYGTNIDWELAGQAFYAGVNEMMFVFNVDGSGRAVSLSPAATRATLQRQK
jgi:CubicO group peptidase (beta-lactamase class C family)